MNDAIIMKEMIDNNQSCRVIKEGDDILVKLRPMSVLEGLKGKLSNEDIEYCNNIMNKQITVNTLKTNLYGRCINTSCTNQNQSVFRAVPTGNIDSKVMLVNKQPTQYDVCNMSTHCNKEDMFLSLILSKINVSINSVYCTDMVKCNGSINEQSCKDCVKNYLEKEINFIKPHIIICNGLCVLNAFAGMNIVNGLPESLSYGIIYDATTLLGRSIKITAIYDLNRVLQKQGSDYVNCKGKLWKQITQAFDAIK